MVIEGTIVGVMETWPLQLSVDTGEDVCQVSLAQSTSITYGGRPADPAHLLPGRRVRVEGESSNAHAMKAERIDIGVAAT